MEAESVHMVCTSPPYWGLRDYGTARWEGGHSDCDHRKDGERRQLPHGDGRANDCYANERVLIPGAGAAFKDICGKCGAVRVDGQLGLERTPEAYIAKMVSVFREVRRVLRKDGTLWLNIGDSYTSGGRDTHGTRIGYKQETNAGCLSVQNARPELPAGLKPKDLCGIPWMLAFALRADGWWLRQDIIWSKPNPMPESVTDRCTKAHEYLFLLTKSERYYFDAEAIKELSVTGDERRPYGSEGGWQLDDRPAEQRHGGKPRNGANSLRGQGAERDNQNGPANRDGRDMSAVGIGATRNKRSVWEIATSPFPEAHFATFPPKLVEPCILAGTSEKGCCSECGAPWERITERGLTAHDGDTATAYGEGSTAGRLARLRQAARERGEEYINETRTVGWEPSCDCKRSYPEYNVRDITACTVLDPFCGAGTSGLVATRLGRNFIGLELKPEYAEMARRRIEQDAPLFNTQPAMFHVEPSRMK